jgi:hypothetical protein
VQQLPPAQKHIYLPQGVRLRDLNVSSEPKKPNERAYAYTTMITGLVISAKRLISSRELRTEAGGHREIIQSINCKQDLSGQNTCSGKYHR